jgi:hypothetical protein
VDIAKAYELLEVPPSATSAEIRLAYLELAKVWHPDRFQSDPALFRRAEERQKSLNAAYAAIKTAPLLRPDQNSPQSEPPPPRSTAPPRAPSPAKPHRSPVKQAKRRILDWRAAAFWAAVTAVLLPRSGAIALLIRVGDLTPKDALVAAVDLPIAMLLNALFFGALTSLLMRVMHGAVAVVLTGLTMGCMAAILGIGMAALTPSAENPTKGPGRETEAPSTQERLASPRVPTPSFSWPTRRSPGSPIIVKHVTLGSEVNADKQVTKPTMTFRPSDTVYASIETEGAGTLAIVWSYQYEGRWMRVHERSLSLSGPATSEAHVSMPNGWPPGVYAVEVLVGDSKLSQALQYWSVN